MPQPKYSVITITYNAAKYLERTLQSVTGQSYPGIEYIIVDGASTDNTPEIIRKYREKISLVISEKDNGIYDAMNKGLAAATGDYVWFMNAGDSFFDPDTVSNVTEQITAYSCLPDILYGHTAITDANGQFLYMRRLAPPEKLTWKSFRMGMLVCHQAFVAKRSLAGPYNLAYKYSADVDWCIRCMKVANVLHNTHLTLANYMNEGTTTGHLKQSFKERYKIMSHYYGAVTVFLLHIWFAIRFTVAKYILRKI